MQQQCKQQGHEQPIQKEGQGWGGATTTPHSSTVLLHQRAPTDSATPVARFVIELMAPHGIL